MIRKNLVFLGSKPIGYDCFEYLLASSDALNVEVTGLLTQHRKEFSKEKDLHLLAEQYGVPMFDSLDDLPECDILYSVQYHKLLRQRHIDKAREIALNLHMAPLPRYRGCNQFSFAIIDGETTFGATIHKIDTRIDHGDILFQETFPIPVGCWVEELYQLTEAASLTLFKNTIADVISGKYTLIPQADIAAGSGSSLHFRNEIDELKKIDLGWDKEKIERHIRATMMPGFEPPYFMMNGKKIHFEPNS